MMCSAHCQVGNVTNDLAGEFQNTLSKKVNTWINARIEGAARVLGQSADQAEEEATKRFNSLALKIDKQLKPQMRAMQTLMKSVERQKNHMEKPTELLASSKNLQKLETSFKEAMSETAKNSKKVKELKKQFDDEMAKVDACLQELQTNASQGLRTLPSLRMFSHDIALLRKWGIFWSSPSQGS